MEVIKAKIEQIYCAKPTWAAVRIVYQDEVGIDRKINASGKIINPVKGTIVLLEGEFFEDKQYGPKFLVEKCKLDESLKSNAAVYFKSGLLKGVGPAIADRIIAKFGNDAIRILDEEPEKLTEIKGITQKKLKKIIESHKTHSAMIELVDFFEGNISENQLNKIWEKYGVDSMKTIKKDPYQLIYDIDGFGFKKVDALALASGVKKDSPKRIGAALYYSLVSAYQFGHCFLDIDAIEESMIGLVLPYPKWLTPSMKKVSGFVKEWTDNNREACRYALLNSKFVSEEAYAKMTDQNDIVEELLSDIDNWHEKKIALFGNIIQVMQKEVEKKHIVIDDERIYTSAMYSYEVSLAKKVNELLEHTPKKISNEIIDDAISKSESVQGFVFEREQRTCIHAACQYPVNIITGGPGTGKSTILNTILRVFPKKDMCFLLAPTGKAAQRMTEVTGLKADTVHHFAYCDRYAGECIPEITGKRIFLDEASMADLPLMSALFAKLKPGDYITLLGDVDQLPSIGAGNVLRDMIYAKKVPTTKLKFTHRFGGTIGFNAEKINNGVSMKHLRLDDVFVFEEVPKDFIEQKVVDVYLDLAKRFKLEDICCLVPVRKKGKSRSAVESLNEIIREKLNPMGGFNIDLSLKKELFGFREGDRIMQMQNDHDKETWTDENKYDNGVYNGECGVIHKADEEEGVLIIRLDDGRYYECNQKEVINLSLSYVSTIHKSQGSQYKAVIIVHNDEHKYMLNKNLFYTGVTRAKQYVHLLGDKGAFEYAIWNDKVADRNTYLISRIEDDL